MDIKLIALILEAHIATLTGKRRFGETLSESLKLNYDIDAKFPDRDSQEILNIYLDRSDTTTDKPMETEQPTTDTDDGPQSQRKSKKNRKRQRTTPTNTEQPPPQKPKQDDKTTDLPPAPQRPRS